MEGGRRISASPRPCNGRRVVAKKRPRIGGVDGFVNSVKKLQRREISSKRDRAFTMSDAQERFRNIRLQEEYDTHDPKGHCAMVLPFLRKRSKIIEIVAARDIVFALAQSGVCAAFSRETNQRICFLNVSPDEVIRSLFYNKNNDSLITVSVYASDNFSSLKCRSTRIEYIRRGKPDAGFALFESESLKWPGFVEFDDVNGKVLTYSAQDSIYKVFDLKNYTMLYSISDKNVQEIKISPGIMLLIFTKASSHVPLKILSIEDGTVLKSFNRDPPMATLSALATTWPDPNSAAAFLSDPTDDNPTSVVDSSDDNHDPQSPPNPNSDHNLHNNIPLSSSPPESAPPAPRSPPSLFHVCFNQDQACFAVGTDHGFRIYNCDPFRELFRRDFDNGGGIGVVEMLFRCNILAIVGGGPDPQYPTNKVMIWDDHQGRCIGELSFRSVIRSVRLRRDRIVVVLEQKIFVYNFADLKLLHQIETIANPKGLCAVSQVAGSLVLVCPGLQKGQVRVEHYGSKRTKFIMAHDSRLACFALTPDGQLLATASNKGTLVRIFNTLDGTLLQEVRRGADRAEIYSLAFSSTAQWLAVSSDKGTVHVFNLKVNSGSSNENPRSASDPNLAVSSSNSSLSFIRGVLPKYFSSEWSVAQFRLLEGSQYIVAFGHQKNTVVILGMDGSFYRCEFDPVNGGEMTQLEYHNFLKPEEAF